MTSKTSITGSLYLNDHLIFTALGKTGDGKSSLLNSMLCLQDTNRFEEKADTRSVTTRVATRTGLWLGSGDKCMVLDTPGLCDSENRDVYQVPQIAEFIKNLSSGLNAFLLVFKVMNLRCDV